MIVCLSLSVCVCVCVSHTMYPAFLTHSPVHTPGSGCGTYFSVRDLFQSASVYTHTRTHAHAQTHTHTHTHVVGQDIAALPSVDG